MKNKVRNTDSIIKAGEVLITEEPYVCVLSSKEQGNRCDFCFKQGKVLKCSGCQFIHYCGRVCQKDAWNEHKWECSNLKRIAPKVIPDAARMLAKIISRQSRGDGNSYRAFYSPTGFRMWKDLMSHYSDLKSDKRRMDHFTTLGMVLYEFLKDTSLPNTVELMGLYGRMVINSFTILDSEMSSIGTGVYLGCSIVDHSCDPNAVATFEGRTISIRATKDLQALDWNQASDWIVHGKMVINSFTILDSEMSSIGTGVYLGCSIVDHSCDPNAVATFEGRTISIRATKDLQALDWNQIRISYIDLMKTPYERQKELLENYYFLCQCNRCLDETQLKTVHAAKCLNNNCNSPVLVPWKQNCQLVINERIVTNSDTENAQISNNSLIKNGGDHFTQNGGAEVTQNGCIDYQDGVDDILRCTDCGTKYPEQNAESFKKTMELTETHLREMNNASIAYVDVCKYCLERQEGVLHPLNVLYAQTLDHAFDALIQLQLWQQACKYADSLIPCFRFYYGDRHPLLGLLHLKYGKILLYKMEIYNALENLKTSEKILKITHGEKHALYREELLPLLRQAMMESK